MSRSISLIIDELAVAACEQGIDADTLCSMVWLAAIEADVLESGDVDQELK